MTYVITQNCCNDASCVAACPVGCIHPTPDEPGFATTDMLYIDPATCIDCGACADACPVDAILPDNKLTAASTAYRDINAEYYRQHASPPTFTRTAPPRPLVTSTAPLHVAIVGAGPAGLYSAKALLHHPGVRVDMFEQLSMPNGLVRYGVAPDHPATKAVVDQFEFSPDKRRRYRLHLGVQIGSDVTHSELADHFDAVIYATGAFHPRRLDIAGAELPGSLPAAQFVGWYNDHPYYRRLGCDLVGRRAVIIGNGNVALDMARILTADPETLQRNGIARHVLTTLERSTIDEVVIIGRRGPEHAAFTVPELLALTHIRDLDLVVEAANLTSGVPSSPKIRLLNEIAATPTKGAGARIVLRFNTDPTAILGEHHVSGLQVQTAAGTRSEIATRLVLHSIGFHGQPVAGLPFDHEQHTIPHRDGRVIDPNSGRVLAGVYTAGWIKRGSTGVIGTNRTCAETTVSGLLEDHCAGRLTRHRLSVEQLLARVPDAAGTTKRPSGQW